MDLETLIERIDTHYNQSLPFVVYRKPNTDIVTAILQSNNRRYTTMDYTKTGFVFAPFDGKDETVLIPLEKSEALFALALDSETHDGKANLLTSEDNSLRVYHINLVKKGIEAIHRGELLKVVLSRKEEVPISETKPTAIFRRLMDHYPLAFVYCFYHPKVGTWLGATPETLLKIEGHKFFTTALAGTQKYDGTIDVLWGQKEIEEQQLVTNFIMDSTKSMVSRLNLEEVQTVKAGSLLHLKTNISGTLDLTTFDFGTLLKTLHPTPAVCGLPKDNAKQFILKNESYDREYYTGFLGELNFKERKSRQTKRHNAENDAFATVMNVSNLYVNLRCMQLKPTKALIYVGGGITKASHPEAEWEETVNKTQTIKSVL